MRSTSVLLCNSHQVRVTIGTSQQMAADSAPGYSGFQFARVRQDERPGKVRRLTLAVALATAHRTIRRSIDQHDGQLLVSSLHSLLPDCA